MAKTHAPAPPGRGRALVEEIRARIDDGTYAAGSALPSTRALAAERGLSRTTVSAVYEQLSAEGLIETRAGSASRVAAGARAPAAASRAASSGPRAVRPAPPPRLSKFGERVVRVGIESPHPPSRGDIDFAYGPLSGRDFPSLRWQRAARQVARERPDRLAYTDPRGEPALRTALQAYLARARGITCSVEQLLIASGSQQVLDLCARLLLNAGDRVAVENPGYRMAHRAFEAVGARLHPVAVDQHGIVTRRLPKAATRLACVTPTHQFPLGAFLTVPRRHELLAWAAAHDAWIVEDDYDGEYRYAIRPEPTLHTLDATQRVVYVGTFSKTLSPELRLGYAVLPDALVDAFTQAKQLADRHAPSGAQKTLAKLLADGSYERHVRRIRRQQQARRVALLHALETHLHGRVRVEGTASGLHMVVWIDGLRADREPDVVAAAQQQRVRVYPLSPLYLPATPPSAPRPAGLVVGYALLDAAQIERGVRALAAVLRRLGA